MEKDTINQTAAEPAPDNINRIDDQRFLKKLDQLITVSEDMRIKRMKQHRTRGFISMNVSILSIMIGIGGFGWFFLMKGELFISCILFGLSIIPGVLMHFWASTPLKKYAREHKTVFMPKLANTLNGLNFHPTRGVSSKIINKLAVIPAHDDYKAEDCFMGTYKGVKVIFSEARLHSKTQKKGPVFDGIFVLLENPEDVIEGHTIITANTKMVKAYASTRWKDMSQVNINVSNPDWDKFHIYSTKPETAELMVGERLIKELAEAADVFDNSPLTAVLFGGKYVFMMIPYEPDMFEASGLFVPVATKSKATKVKKEIEQLLEIIDVFDLYKPIQS